MAAAYDITAAQGALAGSADVSAGPGKILQVVGLAFLGGIILNLMPCVFPVLFIKGLALVQSSGEERSRMRAHGWVYTLGILVSFWIVVALLLVLRTGGRQFGWGFQFQSPSFVAVMALLLFFLGLSLAGMFEIGLTLTSAGGSLASKSGYAGSFFTGILAMVVATPCTAPFMGLAIGFALAQPAAITFLIFTALGLGLAAPYLLLSFNPGWTRLLPRPGAWMEVLKQATAVPIFATVIWLVWLFTQSAGVNALIGLLGAFLLLAVAGWVLGRWPAKRLPTAVAALLLLAAIALPVYAMRKFAPPSIAAARTGSSDWQSYSPQLLEQYRAQGRPVFVDFTASWCLSCQVNERVVLERARCAAAPSCQRHRAGPRGLDPPRRNHRPRPRRAWPQRRAHLCALFRLRRRSRRRFCPRCLPPASSSTRSTRSSRPGERDCKLVPHLHLSSDRKGFMTAVFPPYGARPAEVQHAG